MNLNNLITAETAVKRLKAAVQDRAVWGTTRVTADEDLTSGMLSVVFSRSHGVTATLTVWMNNDRFEQQLPFHRHETTLYARVADVEVMVTAGQMTCKPSIAIAQAALHRDVAELACTLEAMAFEWTVGVPCDADGRMITNTREKVDGV